MKASLVSMELEDLTEENEEQKKRLSIDFSDEFEFLDWKRRKVENTQEPKTTISTEEKALKTEAPPEIKKLYRQIALKTHPDKFEDEYLNDIFTQAATAMEQENWMLLVELAGEIKLDIDFLSDETCEIIEKSIENSEAQISVIRNSFSFIWANQKNEKDRMLFTLLFYKQFKINKDEFDEWVKEHKDKKS